MVLRPPHPIADILIMDNNPMTLFLLSLFRRYHQYRLVYVHHLKQILELQEFYDSMRVVPDLIGAKAIVGADCVIVQSKCLADVFRGYDTFLLFHTSYIHCQSRSSKVITARKVKIKSNGLGN